MKIQNVKDVEWFDSTCEQVNQLQSQKEELEKQIDQLKAQLSEKAKSLSEDATTETDKWAITCSPTISYSLSDDGYKAVEAKYGLDSAYFEKPKPIMKVVKAKGEFDQFISAKIGKEKIAVKHIVLAKE